MNFWITTKFFLLKTKSEPLVDIQSQYVWQLIPYISLLKIIIDEKITNKAPDKVLQVGISFQIKYPKKMANGNAKYLRGVTKDTSDNLYAWVNNKFATPPKIPIIESKKKSFTLGISQPSKIVKVLQTNILNEKQKPINQIGSVVDSCLNVIDT